jgi:hypothetical protein
LSQNQSESPRETGDQAATRLRDRFVKGPFDLTGAIDLHVHTAPCFFERIGDDVQVATHARDAGMRALAYKSHHESTVSRGYHTELQVPGIRIIGGICLNYCVGGINPAAVEAALMLGGRIVWAPSGHACYHGLLTGELGKWGIGGMVMPALNNLGITVLDDQGKLTRETVDVLALVKKHDALFCTSHLSPQEIRAVVKYCKEIDCKVMVNHAYYFPRCDIDFVLEIAGMGAYIEMVSTLLIPSAHRKELKYDYELVAETIKRVGPSRCVLATDAGNVFTGLWPHEQMRMFGQRLLGYGVELKDVRTMMCDNPAQLVGL